METSTVDSGSQEAWIIEDNFVNALNLISIKTRVANGEAVRVFKCCLLYLIKITAYAQFRITRIQVDMHTYNQFPVVGGVDISLLTIDGECIVNYVYFVFK